MGAVHYGEQKEWGKQADVLFKWDICLIVWFDLLDSSCMNLYSADFMLYFFIHSLIFLKVLHCELNPQGWTFQHI